MTVGTLRRMRISNRLTGPLLVSGRRPRARLRGTYPLFEPPWADDRLDGGPDLFGVPFFRETQRQLPVGRLYAVGTAWRLGQRFFHSCRRRLITFTRSEQHTGRTTHCGGDGANCDLKRSWENAKIWIETRNPTTTPDLVFAQITVIYTTLDKIRHQSYQYCCAYHTPAMFSM